MQEGFLPTGHASSDLLTLIMQKQRGPRTMMIRGPLRIFLEVFIT